MKECNSLRLKNGLAGAGISVFFCAVAYSLSAVFFSELRDPSLALSLMTALSFVSAAVYLLLEWTVYRKTGSSAFAIGYFGTLAIISALIFFATNILPMSYIFDYSASVNASFVRLACMRLCIFNAVALVIRLGCETLKYIKAVFASDN